ncbi:MAG: DegT/DnrJ/EryC1/StrS family aminotransferase, partial [Candidatus Hydrogenedentes bacterium]|nr:DegT/DnrJ/EryC1/StrS family aminotransferase [Candidatus Hydrogenedentota bacterium]
YGTQCEGGDHGAALLAEAGIATGLHYPIPLHRQRAYEHLGYSEGDFPNTEAMASKLLSLPLYPGLTEDQVAYVAEQVAKTLSAV